ncbi:MAG: hypothetical protein ACI4K7_01355, partial [Oscillospiraceae bacterium]
MGVFDCKNMGVLAELGKCTQNGAESDFVGMFDKLSHINGYMNPMGRGSLASSFEGLAEEVMITDLIAEFARKYPERFRSCDPAVIQRYIRAPLIREIIKGTETAYLLADMVLGSVDNNNSNNYVLFYEILQTAVLCGNYRFFDYCAANIESPSSKVESEFLYYLCEHKQYDSLDKLLGNTTREELLEYCRPKPNLYGVDCNMEHKLSCLYELCTRYLPEVTNSDDVPAAVSEFLDEADISEYLNMHTDFSSAGRIRAMPIFEN